MPELNPQGGLSSIDAQVTALQTIVTTLQGQVAAANTLLASVNGTLVSLGAGDYYTKPQTDGLLSTKAEMAHVALKADTSALAGYVPTSRSIVPYGDLLSGGGTLNDNLYLALIKATAEQAAAGLDDSTAMTPVKTKAAIAALAKAYAAKVVFKITATNSAGVVSYVVTVIEQVNVWRVLRLSAGVVEIVFAEPMPTDSYVVIGDYTAVNTDGDGGYGRTAGTVLPKFKTGAVAAGAQAAYDNKTPQLVNVAVPDSYPASEGVSTSTLVTLCVIA